MAVYRNTAPGARGVRGKDGLVMVEAGAEIEIENGDDFGADDFEPVKPTTRPAKAKDAE